MPHVFVCFSAFSSFFSRGIAAVPLLSGILLQENSLCTENCTALAFTFVMNIKCLVDKME